MGLWNIKYPYVNDEVLNLDWILSKIKEMESSLAAWESTAKELETALGDINTMKADIYTLQTDITALKANTKDLEGLVTSLSLIVNSHSRTIDSILEDIDFIDEEINHLFARLKSEVRLLNEKLNTLKYDLQQDYNIKFVHVYDLLEVLQTEIELIDTSVLNPWHAELGLISPDENNKLIYSDLADGCLTAEEYCILGYNASEFADFEISAIDYAKFSKKRLRYLWVYMPVEGTRQEISNVLCSIVDNLYNTYTSTEYSALDLDSDGYSALDLTAEGYLKINSHISGLLSISDAGSGLTANEYEHININD